MEKRVLIENKVVPVAETKLTVGLKAISRPTPEWATIVFRTVLYIALTATLVVQIVKEIPAEVGAIINNYSLEAVALVHALTKLFGLKEIK